MIIVDRTWEIYVGADNATHRIDDEYVSKIVKALDYHGVDGATFTRAEGVWKGQREESVVITLSTDEGTTYRVATTLRDVLNQDAVAYRDAGPALLFV